MRLELVAGEQALNRKIITSQVNRPGLTLAWYPEHFRAERVQIIHDAAKEVNPNILLLCHGGPIAEPEDAQYIL